MTTDAKIIDKLVTARIGLLLKQPFFGNLATRLKIINADDWCPTAATDGRHFYFNTEFIDSLTPRETEFLFGHEVLHCVFDHFQLRIGKRDSQLWNVACDYAVNQILKDYKVGEMPKDEKGKDKGFQDDKYKDWSSEAIYDELYKKAKKNGKSFQDALKKLGKLLDEHIDWDKDSQDNKDKEGKGKGTGSAPKYTKEELKKIRDEMKEAMCQRHNQ